MYVPDNYDAFLSHEAEQESYLSKLPVCCECDEPIQDDHLFEINGELICFDCMKANYMKYTEDYIEG